MLMFALLDAKDLNCHLHFNTMKAVALRKEDTEYKYNTTQYSTQQYITGSITQEETICN